MDLASLTGNINSTLRVMDEQFSLAKKAMGIMPRIEDARVHIRNAAVALHQLSELVYRAEFEGIRQPPDVIHRANAINAGLVDLSAELMLCQNVLAARGSHVQKNSTPAN
jgi:hypothetical protein